MPNIFVEKIIHTPIEEQKIEIVERKGIGHPDSLADGMAEAMSRALSKEYLKRFGAVLHHNTDEAQVVAGKSNPQFGGGEIIKPIYVLLVGRATKEFEGKYIPTDKIAIKAAKEYLRNTMANLDPDDVIFDIKLGEGSTDLQDVFRRKKGGVPLSNDTSFGIGFAPLSETESLVLNV
ncbi:MAG: methionine adenosyltransferase, partial [Archaeoglobaceae archaeon]